MMVAIASRPPVVAGTGLEYSGASLGLNSAYSAAILGAEQTANKDQVSGYLGVDGTGTVNCKLKPRSGTTAEMALITLELGEFGSDDTRHIAYLGDGLTVPGVPMNLNSTSTIVISANGSPTANGLAYQAAYALAKTLTPNGSPLGLTNWATIICGPGRYLIPVGTAFDTSYIATIGWGGSRSVIFDSSTSRIDVGAGVNHMLKGIRFIVTAARPYSLYFNMSAPAEFYHEDLWFDADVDTTGVMFFIGGTTVNGSARFCRTNGTGMYGGFANGIFNGDYEWCECAHRGLGGAVGAASGGTINGRVRFCTITSTAWNVKVAGIVEDSRLIGMGFDRLLAGGRYYRNTILPASGPCFDNAGAAVAIKAAGNILKTFGGGPESSLGAGVTNDLGTMATTNYESDLAA